MYLLMILLVVGSGLRFFRWFCGLLLRIIFGLRMLCGLSRCLSCYIK